MKISVQDGRAALVKEDTLICGSDRSYVAEFEFDESWDEYDKTVIFEAGAVMKTVELTDDVCDIPSDCFEKAGLVLKIGVYGTKNSHQTDTYWCHTSRILYEVEPIDIPTPGPGLPEVTASDNGDVLTVVNGAWDKAAPSGGGEIFYITATNMNNANHTFTSDKTYAEVLTAFKAGKQLMVIGVTEINNGNEHYISNEFFPLYSMPTNLNGEEVMAFSFVKSSIEPAQYIPGSYYPTALYKHFTITSNGVFYNEFRVKSAEAQ